LLIISFFTSSFNSTLRLHLISFQYISSLSPGYSQSETRELGLYKWCVSPNQLSRQRFTKSGLCVWQHFQSKHFELINLMSIVYLQVNYFYLVHTNHHQDFVRASARMFLLKPTLEVYSNNPHQNGEIPKTLFYLTLVSCSPFSLMSFHLSSSFYF
jgi:hypothetical protein